MATAVENLGKLERRLTLSFPLSDVRTEVEKRLKKQAKTARAPGFRPGKVPLKMVAAQYGYQIESDVLNDKVGQAFNDAANEAQLRVAGMPKIEPKQDAPEGMLAFDATFEIYPEVSLPGLEGIEIETVKTDVTDAEIDKTIDILRKQRVHYHTKGEAGEHGDGGEPVAANGDRVTVDFVGVIDGVEFPGGKAEDYAFVLGEGRMLPEFEAATVGLKVGESKTFPLAFPEDYHGKDVAGKTAEFTITLKKLEWAHLPEVDAEFAKTLGIEDGSIEKMREDIKVNLEREVNARIKARNKEAVMDALVKHTEMDVPKVMIEQDSQRLAEQTRQDMAQRGMDVQSLPFPADLFATKAERRVRLGLILSQLVSENNLQATQEQVKAQIEDFSQSYEDPKEVLKYYYSDRRRLGEVEALVLEENVVNYVLGKAKVTTKDIAFDELMGSAAQA
ncbi:MULTISPECIES: trigger factor [Massilia]|uniref:Trigger factor n=2 Tax=Massilia TaxID=149698 RepID=A0A7X3G6A3_9BURK|nr:MULTISPECIES: trigger factor [Telluria group]MDN4045942.1 trigger factor [Massilia sp. YIM B02787]HWU61879.1 trigger factor [Ensifer sp.]KQY08530.1 trigger factor [Massilia sp. Root133]KQZ49187.1 trigger factor [Massilia sp. Root1485]MVW64433.1 trigger factor [Telluria cellulosilytica]